MSPWGRPPFELAGRLLKFPKELGLRLEFAAVWLAIVLARAIPLQVASWLSGNLWRLIAPRLRRQKRALANLELAFPEKSLGERKAIAAAMWENLGRTFAESFRIKTLTESDRIVFEPAEGFDDAAPARSLSSSADFIWGTGRSWRMAASGSAFPSSASTNVYPTPMSKPCCTAFASRSTRRV